MNAYGWIATVLGGVVLFFLARPWAAPLWARYKEWAAKTASGK